MKPTQSGNRIARFYTQQAKPFATPGPAVVSRRPKVSESHRLGGPVAGLAASVLLCLLGVTTAVACGASMLGWTVPLSPSLVGLLVGVAVAVSGGLFSYAAVVSAAVASVETERPV